MQATKTINFHVNWECNADCIYCYRPIGDALPHDQRCEIIRLVSELPGEKRRINFAGGEPTLIKTLPKEIVLAKSFGLETSIITNGSVMVKRGLDKFSQHLDMIGLSVDSNCPSTNRALKRPVHSETQWATLSADIHQRKTLLKINTVVSKLNAAEDLSDFIKRLKPRRWKILRAIPVNGVNDRQSDSWLPSDLEFSEFVDRHAHLTECGIDVIVEDDEDLRGSYVMINPEGRFYDSTSGAYHFSDRILDVGLDVAFNQISYSNEKFIRRFGDYNIVDYMKAGELER